MSKTRNNGVRETPNHALDMTDFQIMGMLVSSADNRQISEELDMPLSTVQRRVRHILETECLIFNKTLNYRKLGLHKGLVHVYVKGGDMDAVATQLVDMEGILNASRHVGNSDVVGEFVYREDKELADLLSKIRDIECVDHAVWSSEVTFFAATKKATEKTFNRIMSNS
jgi:DNA-binding Lrp family transcriptional regulator